MATPLWATDSGVHFSAKLSKFLRYSAQPLLRFRQFTEMKDAFSKTPGDSFNWDKVANLGTHGKQLVETNTMPVSSQAITKGTLTITEYGNSIPFTFKLDSLSQFDLEGIIEKGLRDDMVKVLDAACHAEFNATPLRYVGSSTTTYVLTTNGTATATNTSALNQYHVANMALELEKRNFRLGEPVFIGSLECIRSLQGAMVSTQQYSEMGYKLIAEGEVGSVNNVHFIKDGNATRLIYDVSTSSTGATSTKAWPGETSLEGFMFVGKPVVEAVAVPEQVRAKEVTDYGRSKGLAWYWLGGFELNRDEAANAEIIKWASAGASAGTPA